MFKHLLEYLHYINSTFAEILNSWGYENCSCYSNALFYVNLVFEHSFDNFIIFAGARSIREEVKAHAGGEVILPCSINKDECGDFHSIKWYKENRRVFVYSPIADFAKAEGDLLDR